MKHRLIPAGISSLLVGAVLILLEHVLYGYADKNGVLQESLLLPLGVFSVIAGVVLLCIAAIAMLNRRA